MGIKNRLVGSIRQVLITYLTGLSRLIRASLALRSEYFGKFECSKLLNMKFSFVRFFSSSA